MIALRTVLAWVIAPPFSLEKAGFMMTVSSPTVQSVLLRIAHRNEYLSDFCILLISYSNMRISIIPLRELWNDV